MKSLLVRFLISAMVLVAFTSTYATGLAPSPVAHTATVKKAVTAKQKRRALASQHIRGINIMPGK